MIERRAFGESLAGVFAEHLVRAATVDGAAASQQGTTQFTATFIEYGGNVYQILGLAPEAVYSQLRGALQQPAQSFERLTNARYLNRQPSRLDITTVPRATSIQTLLSSRTLPLGVTAEEVAIMNQVTLTETLASGTRVKLPQ